MVHSVQPDAAPGWPPCGFWSLRDVLEVNAQHFMRAVREMRRIQDIIEHGVHQKERYDAIPADIRPRLISDVESLGAAVSALYARAALIAANRLKDDLENNDGLTWDALRGAMADIESRLMDELGLVRMFVLDQTETVYLLQGHELMGQQVSDRFPSVLFEMEEAAKCLALARATASAFHLMRALEIAIKALAAFLEIPDPTKPAERNWGIVLGAIKDQIDLKYPKSKRLPASEGAQVEALYATLDSVKNPWRNATMHVETIYQPYEAQHILQCVNVFLLKLSAICDETGDAVNAPASPVPALQ